MYKYNSVIQGDNLLIALKYKVLLIDLYIYFFFFGEFFQLTLLSDIKLYNLKPNILRQQIIKYIN